MGIEIERKFLVRMERLKLPPEGKRIRQGYLVMEKNVTVRVRTKGEHGFLTIKGESHGASRAEFEYSIPVDEVEEMLDTLCSGYVIEKMRYTIAYGDHLWELDLFDGENAGLVVAEVELGSEGEPFERPEWLGEEVTDDPRYYNAMLAQSPFRSWQE